MDQEMEASLRLVPMSESHISDNLLSWLNDKELMRYSRQRHFIHTYESCLEYLRSFSGSPNYYWAVECFAQNELVGTLNAYVDDMHRTADMGILIGHPMVRGQGCGAKVWKLGMSRLFDEEGILKVTGGANTENHGMVRVFECCGMTLEGCCPQRESSEGRSTNMVFYGILKHEWDSLKNHP